MKKQIFENYNNEYHPIWLPQMRADYDYINKGLEDNGVNFAISNEDPNDLHPLQNGINTDSVDFFQNKIGNREPVDPIYVSRNNEVLDGHHRLYAFKNDPNIKKITCIKLMLNYKDAARILNKIQDKFEFEKAFDKSGDIADPLAYVPGNEESVVDENLMSKSNSDSIKLTPHTLYRASPIQNNSKTGNFFLMEHKPKFDHQYDIEFSNLHEIPEEELGKDPFMALAEKWLGSVDQLKEQSVKNALTFETYLHRRIVEEAKKRGFDGIKYGSKFIQAIK